MSLEGYDTKVIIFNDVILPLFMEIKKIYLYSKVRAILSSILYIFIFPLHLVVVGFFILVEILIRISAIIMFLTSECTSSSKEESEEARRDLHTRWTFIQLYKLGDLNHDALQNSKARKATEDS